MKLEDTNPYVRAADIQPAVLEGEGYRMAYDHRLFYILEGEGVFITADGEYPLAPDTLLFFAPAFGYHFRGKMRVIVLNFDMTRDASHLKAPICPPPAAEFSSDRIFNALTVDGLSSPLVRTDGRLFLDELMSIVHNYDPEDQLADAITSAEMKRLLVELLRGERRRGDASGELIEELRRYIRVHAAEISDNSEIARHFGYHPVYIASLFRERTGESLHRAVVSERIRLAKEWLIRTELSIEEIASGTGFSSRSHFCTAFKAAVGISPKQYRLSER